MFWPDSRRDDKSGWAGPDFGKIGGTTKQQVRTALLLPHSDFQTLRHPWIALPSWKILTVNPYHIMKYLLYKLFLRIQK